MGCSIVPATPSEQSKVVQLTNDVSKAGRLRLYLKDWLSITSDKFIIDIVRGFTLPFHVEPVQLREPINHKFSRVEEDKIDKAIMLLLNSGAIKKSQNEVGQFISNVFPVPKSDVTDRLVINLKDLNAFVDCPHFKMEDYRAACTLISYNNFLAVIDQREAYHAIPVEEHHQKYLKFRWKNELYQYTCLPFGLNIAPYIYTKLMKPVLSNMRCFGIKCVSFLDDCMIIGDDEGQCRTYVQYTCKLYSRLGLIVNFEKSQIKPSKTVKFLGFIFNSANGTINLPIEKQAKIKQKCVQGLLGKSVTIQYLAELIGLMISACPTLYYGMLYTKQLEYEKGSLLRIRHDYSQVITLSSEAKNDIRWWLKNINRASRQFTIKKFDIMITTDSSLKGWGIECNGKTAKGSWPYDYQKKHINELEMIAIKIGLKIFVKAQQRVLIRCDNCTAIAYVNNFGGCRSTDCHLISKEIWQWCESQQIQLYASYINTKCNVIADALSREEKDQSDFKLSPKYIQKVFTKFGRPSIDLFAAYLTTQCPQFYSWLPDPESCGVDAFTFTWKDRIYAFTPFCLVGKVLQKLIDDEADGIVIAPFWTAQPWFPFYNKLCRSEIMILKGNDLLFCPYFNRSHHLSSSLKLMAAVLSIKHSSNSTYPRKY